MGYFIFQYTNNIDTFRCGTQDSKYDTASETLKSDLAQAENKIRMQAEALDIITAERGNVQMKLQSVLKEIEAYKGEILFDILNE